MQRLPHSVQSQATRQASRTAITPNSAVVPQQTETFALSAGANASARAFSTEAAAASSSVSRGKNAAPPVPIRKLPGKGSGTGSHRLFNDTYRKSWATPEQKERWETAQRLRAETGKSRGSHDAATPSINIASSDGAGGNNANSRVSNNAVQFVHDKSARSLASGKATLTLLRSSESVAISQDFLKSRSSDSALTKAEVLAPASSNLSGRGLSELHAEATTGGVAGRVTRGSLGVNRGRHLDKLRGIDGVNSEAARTYLAEQQDIAEFEKICAFANTTGPEAHTTPNTVDPGYSSSDLPALEEILPAPGRGDKKKVPTGTQRTAYAQIVQEEREFRQRNRRILGPTGNPEAEKKELENLMGGCVINDVKTSLGGGVMLNSELGIESENHNEGSVDSADSAVPGSAADVTKIDTLTASLLGYEAAIASTKTAPTYRVRDSFKEELYPTTPHNFNSLRPVTEVGFTALDKAVRDHPWESRFDLLKRKVEPRYTSECVGTPRREYQEGMINGVRVRPVFNPYVHLTDAKRYRLDNWPSRNTRLFEPSGKVRVRGGRRKYDLPQDINPVKDELGVWHPPKLSKRYKGDLEKQFYSHSLPWVWDKNFYNPPIHYMDRTPKGPKRWYKKELRRVRIAIAMRKMPELVEKYRKERRDAKRLNWFEGWVVSMLGRRNIGDCIRARKVVAK